MIKLFRTVLFSIASVSLAIASPLVVFAESNRTTYIVMPAENSAGELRGAIAALGEFPEDQLTLIDNLFIVELLPEDAAKLAENPLVAFIEADSQVSISDTQTPTPSWGLDRIDGVFDNGFSYPSSSGEGVRVYVFDTGVAGDHPDLIGRVSQGFDVIGSNQANTDCHYHGTHVAGTIAGTTYGLAKNAQIVPIRVLGCTGSGSTSGILRAVNWTIANHPGSMPAVANLSLGGSRNLSLNAAMASMVDRGITTVVAAGNSYADACKYSPASAPEAITVGATDRFDSKASFSNFGDCVDIFAPGVSIPSANAKNYLSPVALSGTSMAAPHVAGVAALILGVSPGASTEQVENQIYALSQPGVVKNANTVRGNRMAVSPGQAFKPIPTLPGAPEGLRVSDTGTGFVNFNWDAVTGAQSYEVEYRKGSQNTFTLTSVNENSFRVSRLGGAEMAYLRVRAVTDAGTTKFSTLISGRSAVQPPSEPLNVKISATSKTSMTLNWQPPSSLGGALAVQYRVQFKTTGEWFSTTNVSTEARFSSLNEKHTFRVVAFNESGTSIPSAEVVFDPASVYTVSSISTSVNGRAATIDWRSDAPAGTGFEVALQKIGSTTVERLVTVTGNQIVFDSLPKLTSYRVSITPVGGIRGFGSSATFETLATAPDAPRLLGSIKLSDGYRLRFSAPTDNGGSAITSYRLEQLVGSTWTELQSALQLEFDVAAPARGQTAEYRLIAINAIGESPASATLRVSTPAEKATSPQSFSGQVLADGRVLLSWLVPADDGGAAISQYRVETLRAGNWSLVSSTAQLSMTLAALAKGTQASFRVVAVNRAGNSEPSNVIELARDKSVPADITRLSSVIRDGIIQLEWSAPADFGGGTFAGYQVQQKINGSWQPVGQLTTALFTQITFGDPGESRTYRVVALNELGSALGGAERTVVTPFQQASAPRNLAYEVETNRVKFSWDVPQSNGGSDITYYVLSISEDGTSYRNISTVRANSLFSYDLRPVRGKSVWYRVNAVTSRFGNGAFSEAIEVKLPAVAPQDPAALTAQLRQGEGILLSWTAPANDGGSAVSNYRIELRSGSTWQLVGETTELSFLAPLGKAGESMLHRVVAVNEAGSSSGGRTFLSQMGLAPATAPQSLSATVVAGRLVLQWLAPETMGGRLSYYELQQLDGQVFKPLTTTRSLEFRTTVPGPGQSRIYRVVAVTNAGVGAYSDQIEFSSPKVVPSTPSLISIRSVGMTNTVTWRATGINSGGGTLDQAILYREESGSWVKVAQAPVADGTASFANSMFGTTQRYVMTFTNEVGESVPSRPVSLRHAILVTGQATGLSLVTEGSRLRLSWNSPTFDGGSAPSYADIQVSGDGATWTRANFIRYAESTLVNLPAKGKTLSYRVIVRNGAGNSEASEAVSYTTAFTAPGSFSASAFRSGGTIQFRISAPQDFGGYSEVSVHIEQQGTLAWQSSEEFVLGRPGSSQTFSLPLPANRGTYTYRVVISNPSGEVERTVIFRY